MKKRISSVILLAALTLGLCGCGSMFEKEYVSVEDYVPSYQQEQTTDEKVVVKGFVSLRQAILRYVSEGRTEGSIVFDSDYPGDPSEDMASACWQIRTQNALCAYCVDNISYEIMHIVAYDEAVVRISYADFGGRVEDIVQLPFSTGLDELVLEALSEGRRRLELYILNSSYSAESMENIVLQVYRDNPICAPREPKAKVSVYSGTGMQRLYAIEFDYGMTDDELDACRESLSELDVFKGVDVDGMNEGQKALAACSYLVDGCDLTDAAQDNSAYSVLVNGRGNSEGLALAYVELCRELGLRCEIVYGQKDWESHCWNIVSIMGSSYHVDITECMRRGMESGFLLNDQEMWINYRWDISSYASCSGELSYEEVAGLPAILPGAPGANQTPSDENGGGETVESEEKSNQGA